MYNLDIYDIIILDEVLFDMQTVTYLERIKSDKELKVILLNSLLKKDENAALNPVVDKTLTKPLNQERVFELIVDMYNINLMAIPEHMEDELSESGLLTHRSAIIEASGISKESFNDFAGMNLLIVEDNIINQKVLTNILKLSNINIQIANNGEEATNIVKDNNGKFDIVLMDINMPIMDGYAATEMIRTWEEFDTLPIVAFTALALDSEKQKIFNCGMNAFLTKPLVLGKLYNVFKMFYDNATSNQHVESAETRKIIENKYILDVSVGIEYSNNNEAFYMEILKEFMNAYGDSSELFARLVREHRYEQVKMLCLDMRGLTGTIGAKDMYVIINEINQCILYNKKELLDGYIKRYSSELHKLDTFIHHYLSTH